MLTILNGDALDMLRILPDESVNCCVTSPPYYGLRDYGVDGQIGLESTPEQYIERLVDVFREVRRTLRADGTLWVNIGDSFWGGKGSNGSSKARRTADDRGYFQSGGTVMMDTRPSDGKHPEIKPKDLIGIPWMLAFALRADGWYLRQDIIWSKPNPMPESVTDRCTKAHEYIFLLTKSARYFYDYEAMQEPATPRDDGRPFGTRDSGENGQSGRVYDSWRGSKFNDGKNLVNHPNVGMKRSGNKERKQRPCADVLDIGAQAGSIPWEGYTRNRRSVWNIATKPYSEAHFATFPPELPRICILAGCPAGGTVLDPFAGSGTTGKVALELGCRAVLIELNAKYIELIKKRTKTTMGLAL